MKRFFALTVCIAVIAAGFALAACTALFEPSPAPDGSITISIDGLGGAKALFPLASSADIKRYDLFFAPAAGNNASSRTINNANPTGQTVTLSEGNWLVTAKAYMYVNGSIPRQGNIEIPAAISASKPIAINADGKANTLVLNLELNPYEDPALPGFFTWKKDMFMVMSGTNEAVTCLVNNDTKLRIAPLSASGTAAMEIDIANLQDPQNTGSIALVPGQYRVNINGTADALMGATETVGITELLDIYSGMETKFPFDASDIISTKVMLGAVGIADGTALDSATSVRLTAKSYPNSTTTYSTKTVTGDISSSLKLANNGGNHASWELRVPTAVESAILEVEFLNSTNTVLYRDTRLATNIGGTVPQLDASDNVTGYIPKMEVLTYVATARTAAFWYGNNLMTADPATNAPVSVNSGNTVSSGATYTMSGATGNTAKFINMYNSSSRSFYPGSMIWVEVARAANYSMIRFNASVPNSSVSYNLLSMFFRNDYTKSVYCIPMDTSLDNNLRIDINFLNSSTAVKPKIVCYGDSITLGIGEGGTDEGSSVSSNNWIVTNPTFSIKQTYPWHLTQKLDTTKVEVINRGLEGNGTSAAVQGGVQLQGWNWQTNQGEIRESGLFTDLINLNPDVAIINLGINDFLPGYQNGIDSTVSTIAYNYGIILRELCDGKRKVYVARFLSSQAMRDYLTRYKYPVDRQNEIIAKFDAMFEWVKTFPGVKVIDIWDGVWGGDKANNIVLNGVHPNGAGYKQIAENVFNAIKGDLTQNWIKP